MLRVGRKEISYKVFDMFKEETMLVVYLMADIDNCVGSHDRTNPLFAEVNLQ